MHTSVSISIIILLIHLWSCGFSFYLNLTRAYFWKSGLAFYRNTSLHRHIYFLSYRNEALKLFYAPTAVSDVFKGQTEQNKR